MVLHIPPTPPCSALPAGIALTLLVVFGLRLLDGDIFQAADAWDLGDSSFGAGDALGALLWATSLYFINPIQVRRQAAG